MAKTAKKAAKRPYKRRQNVVPQLIVNKTASIMSALYKQFLLDEKQKKEAELQIINDELAQIS